MDDNERVGSDQPVARPMRYAIYCRTASVGPDPDQPPPRPRTANERKPMTTITAVRNQGKRQETNSARAIAAVPEAIEAYCADTADLEAHLTEFARQIYLVLHEADALEKSPHAPEWDQWAKLPWGWVIYYERYTQGERYNLTHASGALMMWEGSKGHVNLDRLDADLAAGWWDVLLEYASAPKAKRKHILRQVRPDDLDEASSGIGMGITDE